MYYNPLIPDMGGYQKLSQQLSSFGSPSDIYQGWMNFPKPGQPDYGTSSAYPMMGTPSGGGGGDVIGNALAGGASRGGGGIFPGQGPLSTVGNMIGGEVLKSTLAPLTAPISGALTKAVPMMFGK